MVLLATCSDMPDGEEWVGTSHLPAAFAERDIDARWVVWDDPTVDWAAGLVAVRSTWDYEWRREEFLAWARTVPWMLNSADGLRVEHRQVLPPRAGCSRRPRGRDCPRRSRGRPAGSDRPGLGSQVSAAEVSGADGRPQAVVKPTVGAGGRGLVVVGGPDALDESGFGPGPWVVQPMVDSVRTEGETSVFVLDGQVVSQAQKVPAAGEIRVHEQYGGTTVAVPVSDEAADLARRTVEVASSLLGERLDYARVDQMRLADGTLAVSELEITEPGLYLEVLPENADAFADLVAARLTGR